MSTTRTADGVGKVLGGRYRLMAAVGAGGSAHVYLADDITLRRQVAVKILHAGLAGDDRFLRRFRAEAQAVAALNHPHVVRVYDWGEDAAGPWLVMEALSGGSLRDLLDAGNLLSPAQAAVIGLEAARALDYAHRRGFVHRDVKPANFMFDDEGRLRVADFGLARALAEAALTEPAGTVLGTARYVSPEQVQGLTLDGKSDVYSLALVMYESITGVVPFQADTTVATLMGRLSIPLPKDKRLGGLQDVLLQAAAINPENRLDTAQLVQALIDVIPSLGAPGPLPLATMKPMDSSTVVDLRDLTEMGARPSNNPQLVVLPTVESLQTTNGTSDVGGDDAPGLLKVQGPKSKRVRRLFTGTKRKLGGLPIIRHRKRGIKSVQAVKHPTWKRWMFRLMRIFVAIIIGLSLGYGIWTVQRGYVDVPSVVGQELVAAQNTYRSNKIGFVIFDEAYDETAPNGVVVSQSVEEGKRVRGYSKIGVTISKGPAPRTIGDYSNALEAEAVGAATTAGLVPVITNDFSEVVEVGRVMSQSPVSGTSDIAKGAQITIVVSNGPAPRVIVDVSGKSFDEAVAAIRAQQLVPVKTEVFDDSAPGTMLGTLPGAGGSIGRDSRVKVLISKGPDLVDVPSVVGQSPSSARAELVDKGFKVESYGPKDATKVLDVKPNAGTALKRGSTVQIVSS